MSKQYKNGKVAIEDPRLEAAEIFDALRASMVVGWAKDMTELTKLSANLYNNFLLMRRYCIC